MKRYIVRIGRIKVGTAQPLVLIAGPCVIESEESALYHAEELVKITSRLNIPFIYKSSYDKANRTSTGSFRGPGLRAGLSILKKVRENFKIPVLSDVHCREEVKAASEVLDVLQVPAFLSRQTDLIIACAKTGKAVNIKKGQFIAPWDMRYVVEKIEQRGNHNILLTERGSCFGYNNLISDMRSLPIMREMGYPVIYDATHSTQLPGGLGRSSGGDNRFVCPLARAAVAMGVDGLFIETHRNPKRALSDGPNMLTLRQLETTLKQIKAISEAL